MHREPLLHMIVPVSPTWVFPDSLFAATSSHVTHPIAVRSFLPKEDLHSVARGDTALLNNGGGVRRNPGCITPEEEAPGPFRKDHRSSGLSSCFFSLHAPRASPSWAGSTRSDRALRRSFAPLRPGER